MRQGFKTNRLQVSLVKTKKSHNQLLSFLISKVNISHTHGRNHIKGKLLLWLLTPLWYGYLVVSNYHNNLTEASTSSPVSSDAVFLGRGAKPPNKAQNSPASASAINFPSSTEDWKLSDIVNVISNTQGNIWYFPQSQHILTHRKIHHNGNTTVTVIDRKSVV